MEECLSSEEDIEKVPCPICFESFTPRDQHVRLDEKTDMGHNNGKAMERQFERGLLQWQRQKGSSPTATLNVTFFGEAGVDTGALRKEFLTEVVAGIEGRFFEGPQQQRIPRYSLNDLDSDLYRTVGEILAVSLAQGGPAPAFFSPWTYSYLCSGRINQKVLNSDSVADVQLRELIDQVESATEHSIIGLSDEILNCGYTGNVSIPNKDTIVRAIILHAVLRLQPMLEQLREGLQLYGLLSLMSQYPDICQPLFVSGEDVKVNAEFVMTSILPQLSDTGTTRHQVELEMMNFIQDSYMKWITGQGHVPLLPSEKKDFAVVIQFNHDCSADFGPHSVCYPVVTACAKTITLPVRHMRPYEKFKNILTEAFQLGQEFSNV
ncbi:G2/M phase-specific E3 ubiquitin-protein ligase [Dissostichus eleginoides]|uniref:G2/M phase-specific E3 ubiquitin-protein ligase n=1 Tax=Dissostichus eleginoides TaxID=100907 RepID=A0AAD9FJZ0_DISEL|nr:G2/M phase-specific E3 ubiquitin-protein ligase [Dissostichus eleginoides]